MNVDDTYEYHVKVLCNVVLNYFNILFNITFIPLSITKLVQF